MDLPSKEKLLEKYWQGETSAAEEVRLKNLCQERPELFSTEEQLLLNGLKKMSALKLPADFGQLVLEEAIQAETPAASIKQLSKFPKYLFRIAASLLLLLSIGWGVQQWSAVNTVASRFESPEVEMEYQEARQALLLIASKMSKVKSVTAALGKFETTSNRIKSVTPN